MSLRGLAELCLHLDCIVLLLFVSTDELGKRERYDRPKFDRTYPAKTAQS